MTDVTTIGHLGPPLKRESAEQTRPPSDPISLEEHDATEPFATSPQDVTFLDSLRGLGQSTSLITVPSVPYCSEDWR